MVGPEAPAASAANAPAVTTVKKPVVVPAAPTSWRRELLDPFSFEVDSAGEPGARWLDQTDVNVLGSGPPLTYHAIRLENPDRLVLDFAGSHLKTSEKHIASNLDPVREIRLAQFTPETSRVVIDLREPAHYNINTNGQHGNRLVYFDANRRAAPRDSVLLQTPRI